MFIVTSVDPLDAQPGARQFISRRELASRWGVSLATIKRRENERLLRPYTFNQRLIRYRLSDVEAFESILLKNP